MNWFACALLNDRRGWQSFRNNQQSSGYLQSCCHPRRHSGAGPPAWMYAYRDVGGRAASGTSGRGGRAAPACSRQVWNEGRGIQWFNNPFPRSGNDNRGDNRLRASGKTGHPFTTAPPPSWIPAFAGMTVEANNGALLILLLRVSACLLLCPQKNTRVAGMTMFTRRPRLFRIRRSDGSGSRQ